MATVKVINKEGQEVGTIDLLDSIFDVEIKEYLVHQAVVQHLANKRQGTKSAKTRAEVRGGGRKPWRQKGTGRARQGSIRSPQWKGGGVVFAPKPRDFSFKLNKKVKRQALKSVLTSKLREDKIVVVEGLKLDEIKTKEAYKVLSKIDCKDALVVFEEKDKNLLYSLRNIPTVKPASVNTMNVYDILCFDKLVVSKDVVDKLQEVYA